MPINYKDINELTEETNIAGTEKVPVSGTKYVIFNKIKDWIINSLKTTGLDLGGKQIKNVAIEVVTSLPTTNNFVGRQVTYQGRSYIWDGSAWKCDSDYLEIGNRNYYSLQGITTTGSFYRKTISVEPNTVYIICTTIPRPSPGLMDCWATSGGTIAESSSLNGVSFDAPIVLTADSDGLITVSFRPTYYNNLLNGIYKIWVTKGNKLVDWTPAPEDKADENHNHDTTYLGITEKSADSDKLDGKHASEFATSTHDHDVYEANLKWGGKNISGGYSPIDAAMVDDLGANRLAFANPAGITIEYSTDGGNTWLDYGASDSAKSSLTATETGLYTGKSTSNLTASPLNMLRVTFDTGVCQVYTALNKIVLYCSTNGSTGSYVTIQKALQSTPDNYINHVENIPISGWPGYNVINIPNLTTYGNSPTVQYGRLRFVFGCTGYNGTSSSHRGLYIGGIKGFGGVGWATPSNMAKRNSLFTYDGLQNAIFPASVQSNQTINFDTNNIEPTQSGTVTKTSTWLWQYLVQSMNYSWLKLKTWVGGLFSAGSATTNNNYLPKIDDVNKKLVKSNIYDDGTTPKYGTNTIWHSGNDGSGSELDADKLDGKHATDFSLDGHTHNYSPTDHDHDTAYLGKTNQAVDSAKLGGLPSGNATGNIPISNGTVNTNLNADLLDGKHASAFATSTHNHDATYLKLTGGTLSGNVNPSTDNSVILGAPSLRYRQIYASQFAGNADTATKLKTPREINGVPFDGTANITVSETIQLLSSGGEILNYLTDGVYRLNSTLPTGNYPDSVCGTKGGSVTPNGTEILRQYTGNNGNHDVKTQIMLIQNETYRRSGLGNYWNEWERLITCRDMANYATIDMLGTFDGEYLEPDVPVDVYRDTTYTIDGEAKEGKYIINLKPLFTSPPLEIIEIYIAISDKSSGEYTLEIQLSDYDIDTRESSSSTTAHFGDYASITIPQGTSFVLLKIYMFENVQRCLIIYTFS